MRPKIKNTQFGAITIGAQTYEHDVVLELDGTVRKRKKKLSKRLFGTSHKISLDEIKDVYQKGAGQLIIGTGQYDQVRLSSEAQEYLEVRGCRAVLLPTPEALVRWNEAKSKTIGLFHVTC